MSRFLKVIVNIILVCAILTAAALLIPPLVGVQTFVMDDMSMQTNLSAGSVTYAIPKSAQEMKNGDKVLEQASTGNYVYRISNLHVEENTCTLTASGTSPLLTKEANISNGVAKVVLTIPFIGYVVMAMKTTEGLIIIGLAVVFVILLFILSEICKKDEDEEDEEEEEEDIVQAEQPRRRRAPRSLPEDQEEEEDEDEDEGLSRKERKRRKKEEKAAEKAARKEAKRKKKRNKYEDEEEDENFPEEEDQQVEPMTVPIPGADHGASVEEQLAFMVQQFDQEQSGNSSTYPIDASTTEEQTAQQSGVSTEELKTPEDENIQKTENSQEIQPSENTSVPDGLEMPLEFQQEESSDESAIPNYTVQELMNKARAAGAKAEVVVDQDSGVTLVDYSDWLKKK